MNVEDNRGTTEIKCLINIKTGECFEYDGIFGGIFIKTDTEIVKDGIKYVKCVNVENGWLCSFRENATVNTIDVKVVIGK